MGLIELMGSQDEMALGARAAYEALLGFALGEVVARSAERVTDASLGLSGERECCPNPAGVPDVAACAGICSKA